jgi:hypothetical protein
LTLCQELVVFFSLKQGCQAGGAEYGQVAFFTTKAGGARVRFLMITLIALSAMSVSGLIYMNRFLIFESLNVEPSGSLEFSQPPTLSSQINAYFEQYHQKKVNRDYICAHQFWAKDQRYAYVDLVCGMFRKTTAGEIKTLYGYRAPTRVSLDPEGRVSGFSQPIGGKYYEADKRRLFPKQVLERAKTFASTQPWNNIHLLAMERIPSE